MGPTQFPLATALVTLFSGIAVNISADDRLRQRRW
jgi:hypothetical protein